MKTKLYWKQYNIIQNIRKLTIFLEIKNLLRLIKQKTED